MKSETTEYLLTLDNDGEMPVIEFEWNDCFHYPSSEVEFIGLDDGSLIQYISGEKKLKMLNKGRYYSEEISDGIMFKGDIKWMVFGPEANFGNNISEKD